MEEVQSIEKPPGLHPSLVIQPLYEAAISASKDRGGSAAGIDASGPLTGKWNQIGRDNAASSSESLFLTYFQLFYITCAGQMPKMTTLSTLSQRDGLKGPLRPLKALGGTIRGFTSITPAMSRTHLPVMERRICRDSKASRKALTHRVYLHQQGCVKAFSNCYKLSMVVQQQFEELSRFLLHMQAILGSNAPFGHSNYSIYFAK